MSGAALALLLGLGPARAAGTGELVLEVGPLRSGAGQVIVAVYASDDGFPLDLDRALILKRVPVVDGAARVSLALPFGSYAVAAIHDENGNNTLDTSWLGLPREGVACSNNAHGRFGPPAFEDAVLQFGKDGQVIPMKMAYL